jgi:hypothetical protein
MKRRRRKSRYLDEEGVVVSPVVEFAKSDGDLL